MRTGCPGSHQARPQPWPPPGHTPALAHTAPFTSTPGYPSLSCPSQVPLESPHPASPKALFPSWSFPLVIHRPCPAPRGGEAAFVSCFQFPNILPPSSLKHWVPSSRCSMKEALVMPPGSLKISAPGSLTLSSTHTCLCSGRFHHPHQRSLQLLPCGVRGLLLSHHLPFPRPQPPAPLTPLRLCHPK